MALAESVPLNAAIESIIGRQRALPAQFNIQRAGLAANTAAELGERGLFDAPTTIAERFGNQERFRLGGGQLGFQPARAFRESARSTRAGLAAANAGGGTFERRRLREGAKALQSERDAILREFSGRQALTFDQQAQTGYNLERDLYGARQDLAEYQASRPVPAPSREQARAGSRKTGQKDKEGAFDRRILRRGLGPASRAALAAWARRVGEPVVQRQAGDGRWVIVRRSDLK